MVLVLVIAGAVSLMHLPVSLVPDVDIPYISVSASAPGLSASEVESRVAAPLRASLMQISHLSDMSSESHDGSATVKLSFDRGLDMDYVFVEVNEKVDRAWSSLGLREHPKVMKSSATDIPAFFIDVTRNDGWTSDGALLDMGDFVSNVVARRLEQLPEVAMVDISGTARREVVITPHEDRLRSLGLTLDDIRKAVIGADISLSSVSIRDGEYHFNVRMNSSLASIPDLEQIYIKSSDHILRLSDIAHVEERTAQRQGLVRSGGRDAVTIAVIKQGSARMSDLRNAVDEQLEDLRIESPELSFSLQRDQTELLDYSMRSLLLSILLSALLVCVIVAISMKNVRSSVLTALTIPVTIIISFAVFYLCGLSINIISLSGLLLGVGMMVDNTIILVDNMEGMSRRITDLRDAVVAATEEVRGAMLSSILTTCAVFVPLVFIRGVGGDLFRDQAFSIATILFVSYLITILVVPVFYVVLAGKRGVNDSARGSSSRIESIYEKGEAFVHRNGWLSWTLPLLIIAIIALCVWRMDKEKLPEMTYTDSIMRIDWNDQVSVEGNAERVRQIEEMLLPMVDGCTSMIGLQQFVLPIDGNRSSFEAEVYFRAGSAGKMEQVRGELSAFVSERWPDAAVSFEVPGNIFELTFGDRQAWIEARLRPSSDDGLDTPSIASAVDEISAVTGVKTAPVRTQREILYQADRELMKIYDVNEDALSRGLNAGLGADRLTSLSGGSNAVDVVLESSGDDGSLSRYVRESSREVLGVVNAGMEGMYYPLEIGRTGDARGAMDAIRDVARSHGMDVSFTGSWFTSRELMRQLAFILFLSVCLLFLILAAQFESVMQPLIILSEIVIDAALSLLGLWAFGVSINLMSMIGLIVTCGIVINDSILKIDTINKLRARGLGLDEAILTAGRRRLKAILMTSATTILSVVPLLGRGSMGADLQFPMSLVIVIGMLAGTFVSLFYVPLLYRQLARR